jgi:TonB-dependent SusC/RagA subfamily outer membrane receptor
MKKEFLLILLVILPMALSAQNKADTLLLINGKVSNVELSSIDPNTIESVSVIKNQVAIDIYGEAAKNGVILVITKDLVNPISYDTAKYQQAKPLLVVDGEIYKSDLKSIQPEEIESLSVLKNVSATKVYGVAGTNGVIIVTTKRNKTNK